MAGNIYDAEWVVPSQLNVGNGASIFIFVPILPGQILVDILPLSGGSLTITGWGVSRGTSTSMTQKALAPTLIAQSAGFLVPYGTPYRVMGPAAFWLSAGGATCVVGLSYQTRAVVNEL